MQRKAPSKIRKVFVTGGSGYVGLNLLTELLRSESSTQIIALFLKGDKLNTRLRALAKDSEGIIELVEGNILISSTLRDAIPQECDVVYHLAGNVSFDDRDRVFQKKINVEGTANVVTVCLERKAKKYVHISSTSVFGPQETPINEKTSKNAMKGSRHYAYTKFMAEQEVRRAMKKGLDAVFVAPSYILGENDDGNGLSKFFIKLWKKKVPLIPPGKGGFCDVVEVAKALISVSSKPKGTYYVLGGSEATFVELAGLICKELKITPPRFVGPFFLMYSIAFICEWCCCCCEPTATRQQVIALSNRFSVDDSKACDEIGFFKTPIKELVKREVKYLKKIGLLS